MVVIPSLDLVVSYNDATDLDGWVNGRASPTNTALKLLVDAVPEKDGQPQTHEELDVVGTTLLELATGAQEHVHVQSAYLILLDAGVEALADLTSRPSANAARMGPPSAGPPGTARDM